MHQAFTSRNGTKYMAAKTHRRVVPTTTTNPWLKQIFDEQDRLGVSSGMLARASRLDIRTIHRLRHPSHNGKHPTWDQVAALAAAMNFRVPIVLTKGE